MTLAGFDQVNFSRQANKIMLPGTCDFLANPGGLSQDPEQGR
jgi:uncharacterized membrane protein